MGVDVGRSAMSEEHERNASSRTESTESSDSVNRRSFVKSLGVAGGSAMLGTSAMGIAGFTGSAAAEDGEIDSADFEVVDTNELPDGAATKEKDIILSNERIGRMTDMMSDKYGIVHRGQYVLDVVTDNSELNQMNPRFNVLGFSPRDPTDNSVAGLTMILSTDISESASDENREPVAGLVNIIEDSNNGLQLNSTSNTNDVTSYTFDENGEPTVGGREEIEVPTSDGISTNNAALNALCTGGCTAFVSTLCSGVTGRVGLLRCVGVCARFLTSPPVAAGCSVACGFFVRVINQRGCDVGAATICAGACSSI